MKPKRLLTEAENALFDERMAYWQHQLGLNDWRIERGSFKTPAMAAVKLSYADRLATYATGNFGRHDPATAIDSTALHEALHVLLMEFGSVLLASESTDLRMSAEHRVVTTLEKLLIGKS